jgi:signal transduction histidine kinase
VTDPSPRRHDGAPGVSAHAVFAPLARRRPAPGWRANLPAILLAGTLALTAAAAAAVGRSLRAADQARFDNAVQAARDRVDGRIDTYVALLHGARGLFGASENVTAEEFRRYVARLELGRLYPGIRGIGFSRVLATRGAPSDAASLHAALRTGGSPADRLSPAGPRDEYHAIVYLEPRDERNQAALGYDMHSDPTRRVAMDRARDAGGAAASGVVRLRQEIDERTQPGFLVYVPVYAGGLTPPDLASRRRLLRGHAYAAFRVGDLFEGIFGSEREPRVAFRVFDGADTTTARLIYTSGGASRATSRLRAAAVVDVAGRPWTLAFTPLPTSDASTPASLVVTAVALFGTLLGLLLARVTRAEMRAREAAERSDALRGRFFAAMSHELRTPVNAVLGYNDLLLAGVYGPLAPTQEHGIARSQRAAHHLLELINDVLDLSKLEAGKMDVAVEPVPLAEFLDDLLVTIRPMAEERGCELRLERAGCDCAVETDPRRLRQILLNLLSNATKFGAGGPVVVHCTQVPHGAPLPGGAGRGGRRRTADDAVVVAVTDAGPGIPRADQQRIFEEFVQLPGATPGGTGLGLPISRRLAELLGGHLTLESTPGRGSTFAVTIPRRRSR